MATEFCKSYNLKETCIVDHSEGYNIGIASNHGDIKHWFNKFGKTMDDFRADVKKRLNMKDEDIKTTDASVSTWAMDSQLRMVKLGITDGTRPKDTATREEIWVMLDRLYNKLNQK